MTSLLLPHLSSSLRDSLPSLNLLCHSKTDARFLRDAPKAVWSIPYVSVAFFPSLKQNFIAYRSSKVSSYPDCIFEIHQLWQSGFSRVYSNCCRSRSFELEIIKIGQSSHKMYSNNIRNFQQFTTILNTPMKKVWKLIECTSYVCIMACSESLQVFSTGFLQVIRSESLRKKSYAAFRGLAKKTDLLCKRVVDFIQSRSYWVYIGIFKKLPLINNNQLLLISTAISFIVWKLLWTKNLPSLSIKRVSFMIIPVFTLLTWLKLF